MMAALVVQVNKEQEYYDAHYNGNVQPIELMQSTLTKEEFTGFIRGNIIKYCSRLGKKDDQKREAAKILRYAQWLSDVINGKTINPRE